MLLGTFLGVQCLRLCLLIQGVWVQSLVGELRSHMPLGQNTKTWNRSNIVIKSMKSLKMVHIKKKIHVGDWKIQRRRKGGGRNGSDVVTN